MESSKWFLCSRPRPDARVRLFCFPHAGGGAIAFRSWPKQLDPEVELRAVQLPGRDLRRDEPLITRMPALVRALADGLGPSLSRPYAFFGHSMGALVAFELTRHLRSQGKDLPIHLFLSARRAPQIPNREPPCHRLPEAELVSHLVERYNGIPEAVLAEKELLRWYLPILRADFELLETYQYEWDELLDRPLTVFGGAEDRMASADELSGWREVTSGPFQRHLVPGGHFFGPDAEAEVLEVVSRALRSI